MALGDSLEKIFAARRAAGRDPVANEWIAQREEIFAPIVRRLRLLIGGIDSRFIKSRLARERAVIRIGNGEIDVGWEIVPNAARSIDSEAPLLKVTETRDFMSDDRYSQIIYFDDADSLLDHLERRIRERTQDYRRTA